MNKETKALIIFLVVLIIGTIIIYTKLFPHKEYKKSLEEKGYKVVDFGYADLIKDNQLGFVKMKKSNESKTQILDGLKTLNLAFPKSPNYKVEIIGENKTCEYFIKGNEYRNLTKQNESTKIIEKTENSKHCIKN